MDHPYENIINMKYFTNTLLYAWKYHMISSTELIPNKGVWLAAHSKGALKGDTLEQRFYKAKGDSTEDKLDLVLFFIYYNAKFAQRHTFIY